MKAEKALEILKNKPIFYSRLGFFHHPVVLEDDGLPLVFYTEEEAERYCKTVDEFCDKGVKTITSILFDGWIEPNVFDYRETDNVLNKIFASGKVDYYLPRIKLNAGEKWCAQNPEDVCVYYEGPRDPEKVKELCGTLKQDYLGYDSEKGYYVAGSKKNYERPNLNGVISLQSFSSEKWLKDAGNALARLIDHIENGPYADKIIGYHIAFGTSGETMPWGRLNNKFGDYSLKNQRKFLEWGLEKYGSEQALKTAWGRTDFEGDIIPPPEKREVLTEGCLTVRDPDKDRCAIDYERFVADCNLNAISHFGKIIKEKTNGKAVGAFYGYVLHMRRAGYAGHISWEKMLECPYVDFFAAPKSYNRSGPGEPGGSMAPVLSVNAKKLWIDECDNRTHLTTGDSMGNATCPEETYSVHLREFSKNISFDSGLWYMDLGGGWFEDDGIMENVGKITKAFNRITQKKHKSVAEVLAVFDEESARLAEPNYVIYQEICFRELQLAGAPIDTALFSSVSKTNTENIKVAVLLNSHAITKDRILELKKNLPSGCKIVYLNQPVHDIVESGDVVFDFNTKSLEWRKVLEQAKVNLLAPNDCAVYADNRLVSFYPKQDVTIDIDTKGKTYVSVRDGKTICGKAKLDIKAKSGVAFEILD